MAPVRRPRLLPCFAPRASTSDKCRCSVPSAAAVIRQTTYCVWADCEKEFHVLPLFPAIGIPECGDWEFAPLESGEMIMYVRRRTYLVGYDKMLGRCIRNVQFLLARTLCDRRRRDSRISECPLYVVPAVRNGRKQPFSDPAAGSVTTKRPTPLFLSSCLRKTGNFWPAIPIPNSAARR